MICVRIANSHSGRGAAASMAACFTHPLDQTKYRIQVQAIRKPLLRTLHFFAARDAGIFSLWQGLSASILRQSTYSTARFGLYNLFARKAQRSSNTNKLPVSSTMACAGLAGGLAGLLGNPTEVVLVRMCADATKPSAERFNYSDGITGMVRIAKEDGIRAFSRGLVPNVARSVLMNVSQIATYAEVKRRLLSTRPLNLKDDTFTHILSSLAAGTVATTMCAPADVLKSNIQSASNMHGNRQIITRCLIEPLKHEGFTFLMKGWTPAWLRLA
ncbi:mitochondrial carrier [Glonium stellatum]|uniref:Mitochondrial carrier n=1 Tax=Glonium stellatum TaxID=574774 RepID=A0A8E2EXP5_9PEZI|nr:mitochondrial carrier [Glonium stellatum]